MSPLISKRILVRTRSGPSSMTSVLNGMRASKWSGVQLSAIFTSFGILTYSLSLRYTYKVCLFGSAEQKSSRDHYSTNLGTFSRWDGPGEQGAPSWYTKQVYDNGQKCWN